MSRRIVHVSHGRVSSTFKAACAGELDRIVNAIVDVASREPLWGSRWSIGATAVPKLLARLTELGWTVDEDGPHSGGSA